MGRQWRWALVSPDGVVPSRMVGVSASVNLPLHHKVQKFRSGTSSPERSRKNGRKMVVMLLTWELTNTKTNCILLDKKSYSYLQITYEIIS